MRDLKGLPIPYSSRTRAYWLGVGYSAKFHHVKSKFWIIPTIVEVEEVREHVSEGLRLRDTGYMCVCGRKHR